MKKKILLCLLLICLFAACSLQDVLGIDTPPIPYGIWYSEDPNLTLYIDPSRDEAGYYFATYTLDGVEKECLVSIHMHEGGVMIIQPLSAIHDKVLDGGLEYTYFDGHIDYNDNEMSYKLLKYIQEKAHSKKIIFEKIGEYPVASSS